MRTLPLRQTPSSLANVGLPDPEVSTTVAVSVAAARHDCYPCSRGDDICGRSFLNSLNKQVPRIIREIQQMQQVWIMRSMFYGRQSTSDWRRPRRAFRYWPQRGQMFTARC